MEFEWDPGKAAENLRKHKVSFTEAATVLGDFLGTTASDPDHSGANIDTSPSGYQVGAIADGRPRGTPRTDSDHQCSKTDPKRKTSL